MHPTRGGGRVAVAATLGLHPFQVDLARAAGLIPPPGTNGYWSVAQVAAARAQLDTIIERFGDGDDPDAEGAADIISVRFPDLKISADTVRELDDDGTLPGAPNGRAGSIYRASDIQALIRSADAREVIAAAAARGEVLSGSESAARLGIDEITFRRVAAAAGITPTKRRRSLRRRAFCGPLYLRSDIDRLSDHPDVLRHPLPKHDGRHTGTRWRAEPPSFAASPREAQDRV